MEIYFYIKKMYIQKYVCIYLHYYKIQNWLQIFCLKLLNILFEKFGIIPF